MTELKPCPFCGQKSGLFVGNFGRIRLVTCPNHECLAEGPIGNTREEAIAAWNRRHVPEAES